MAGGLRGVSAGSEGGLDADVEESEHEEAAGGSSSARRAALLAHPLPAADAAMSDKKSGDVRRLPTACTLQLCLLTAS